MSGNSFAAIEQAIETIAAGGMVVVVDDEARENEGDFICAAEKITPEMVNFMLRDGRGVLCVPMPPDRAATLQLEPASHSNSALHDTNFTVSVDLATLKSGVSASERCDTIRALAADETTPEKLARPGHIYPLVAHEGGVLHRAGHTEAAVDLVRLAGLTPVGALIEILDEDGQMARGERLFEIARESGTPIVSIEELIRYRRRTETLVERVVETNLPTEDFGELTVYGYKVHFDSSEPIVILKGDIHSVEAPLIRVHSSCFTGEVLDSLRCDCGGQLRGALARIAGEGAGAVVYLPQEGRGIGLLEKLRAYALQDEGLDTVEANLALGYRADMRDYGVGIQILKDLGLKKVRLLTNNPKKQDAFIYYGYNLEVVSQEPIVAPANEHSEAYMRTKRDKMGHLLPDSATEASGAPVAEDDEAEG